MVFTIFSFVGAFIAHVQVSTKLISINEVDIFYCRATEGKAVFGSVSHYKLKLHGFSIIILLFTTFSALLCMIIVFRGHGFSARSVSNTRVPTS